jgi:hypothetical protein
MRNALATSVFAGWFADFSSTPSASSTADFAGQFVGAESARKLLLRGRVELGLDVVRRRGVRGSDHPERIGDGPSVK